MELIQRLLDMSAAADRDPDCIYVLSTGERIAVAFLINRLDLLPSMYSHPLEALDRLDEGWGKAIIQAHNIRRSGH